MKIILTKSRGRALTGVAAAILLLLFLWCIDPYRTVPLHKALNPWYWVLHWQGRDRYDARTALLEHGDPGQPSIALTIDDGPDPRYGPAIAHLLKQRGVPATFFLVGTRAKQYPAVVRQLADEGFEIGNHTYDHQRLPDLKPHEIANELRLCDRWITEITGRHTTLMRPPGVQYDDKVLHVAKALGYVTVSWTEGARDYDPQPPGFIAERVVDRAEPGAIILLHQDTPSTLSALPDIIDRLRARGYRFVTISQMLQELHVRPMPRTTVALTKSGPVR